MKMGRSSLFLGWVLFSFCGLLQAAPEDIKIKVLAVNPSPERDLRTTVTHYLPNEITSEQDVIDKAGMEIRYDAQKKLYYLSKEVALNPQQTMTFEVRVRDVWVLDPEKIEGTRKDLERQISGLAGTPYYETAKLLYDKALESLDRIVAEQSQPKGVKQHVELCRAHAVQFNEIIENALSLDAMRRLQEEKKKGVREARFVIEAENPSRDPKTITVRSVLPKDIKPDDLLDKQGFDVLFDQDQKTYLLQRQDEFSPREHKKYTIVIRDIWSIPDEILNSLQNQTERLVRLLKPTPYEKFAEEQGNIALALLGEIRKLQEEVSGSLSLEERMRAFVANSQKLEVVKAKIRDLQQLFLEIPEKREDPLEKLRILIKKLAEIKNLVLVAMGFTPDRPITWWIILGIILFLGVMSGIFYMAWLKKLQENKWVKRGGGELQPEPPPAATDEKKEASEQKNA